MTTILRARALSKADPREPGFAPVDIDLAGGECVGVDAADPRSRTALLQVLATLIAPSAGTLEVDGINALAQVYRARRRLVYAGACAASGRGLAVREYLVEAHRARVGQQPAPGAVDGALELTGLAALTSVDALSERENRNLLLAVALLCRPRVVLVDGADDDDAGRLAAAIGEMRRHEMAVMVAVNGSAAVRGACQRVLRIEPRSQARELGMPRAAAVART